MCVYCRVTRRKKKKEKITYESKVMAGEGKIRKKREEGKTERVQMKEWLVWLASLKDGGISEGGGNDGNRWL